MPKSTRQFSHCEMENSPSILNLSTFAGSSLPDSSNSSTIKLILQRWRQKVIGEYRAIVGDLNPVDYARELKIEIGESHNEIVANNVLAGQPQTFDIEYLNFGSLEPAAMDEVIDREHTHFSDCSDVARIGSHGRECAAYGYFESYQDLSAFTLAAPFEKAGKCTPLLVRFSTMADHHRTADTVRDVRSFDVKFYTDKGQWDLLAINMPVGFLSTSIELPELLSGSSFALAADLESADELSSTATHQDIFWDFVSLLPESSHRLLWQMSERALPRSYRMMQGFGVKTFRLRNAESEVYFCKFHWRPLAGVHSLAWGEALTISKVDPEFLRRDLWDAIEAGIFPEWELGLQIFTEEMAEQFEFDAADLTKIIPEEWVPITPVGKMTLNRNPDSFFCEVDEIEFLASNSIPGIDIFSKLVAQYPDAETIAANHLVIHRGRVSYAPLSVKNSEMFADPGTEIRRHAELSPQLANKQEADTFSSCYSQARIFWNSQRVIEQKHIIDALCSELSQIHFLTVQQQVLTLLNNIDAGLAMAVAKGLGIEAVPNTGISPDNINLAVAAVSPGLSVFVHPGEDGIHMRRVAILVSDGVEESIARKLYATLLKEGAVPRFVGSRLGKVASLEGGTLDIEITFEAGPSVLYDAVIVANCDIADDGLIESEFCHFVMEQYQHGKPIFAIERGQQLLAKAKISTTLKDGTHDPFVVVSKNDGLLLAFENFKNCLSSHRFFEREIH